jgi:hypothetical protein
VKFDLATENLGFKNDISSPMNDLAATPQSKEMSRYNSATDLILKGDIDQKATVEAQAQNGDSNNDQTKEFKNPPLDDNEWELEL